MRSRQSTQAAMLLLWMAFLAYSPAVLAAESAPRVLGTVVASGTASMKAGLDRWVPVDEKTHPVVDGTALKTEDGTMSVTMRGGASLEVGKRTDLVVGGAPGNYSMRLQLGTVAFKIYEGMGLSVTTPSTSVVVQRASGAVEQTRHTFKDEISGIITHDGKDTQVICLRGKFNVMQANADTRILTEGNRIGVASSEAATQAQGTTLPASGASASTVRAYESPNVPERFVPETRTVPQLVAPLETGGLEVGSETIP